MEPNKAEATKHGSLAPYINVEAALEKLKGRPRGWLHPDSGLRGSALSLAGKALSVELLRPSDQNSCSTSGSEGSLQASGRCG